MQPGLLGQLCKSHPPETPTAARREERSPRITIFQLCEQLNSQSLEDTNALLEVTTKRLLNVESLT